MGASVSAYWPGITDEQRETILARKDRMVAKGMALRQEGKAGHQAILEEWAKENPDAERLHQLVRTRLWGYEPDEQLDNDDLIAEKYIGIRPAMGYPASPDHTEKDLLWELLDAEANTGIWLTESKAMVPTAAVSGLYFAHPDARYFAVGKLNRDQVADYAERKEMTLAEMERWLAPNLAYDPE